MERLCHTQQEPEVRLPMSGGQYLSGHKRYKCIIKCFSIKKVWVVIHVTTWCKPFYRYGLIVVFCCLRSSWTSVKDNLMSYALNLFLNDFLSKNSCDRETIILIRILLLKQWSVVVLMFKLIEFEFKYTFLMLVHNIKF